MTFRGTMNVSTYNSYKGGLQMLVRYTQVGILDYDDIFDTSFVDVSSGADVIFCADEAEFNKSSGLILHNRTGKSVIIPMTLDNAQQLRFWKYPASSLDLSMFKGFVLSSADRSKLGNDKRITQYTQLLLNSTWEFNQKVALNTDFRVQSDLHKVRVGSIEDSVILNVISRFVEPNTIVSTAKYMHLFSVEKIPGSYALSLLVEQTDTSDLGGMCDSITKGKTSWTKPEEMLLYLDSENVFSALDDLFNGKQEHIADYRAIHKSLSEQYELVDFCRYCNTHNFSPTASGFIEEQNGPFNSTTDLRGIFGENTSMSTF